MENNPRKQKKRNLSDQFNQDQDEISKLEEIIMQKIQGEISQMEQKNDNIDVKKNDIQNILKEKNRSELQQQNNNNKNDLIQQLQRDLLQGKQCLQKRSFSPKSENEKKFENSASMDMVKNLEKLMNQEKSEKNSNKNMSKKDKQILEQSKNKNLSENLLREQQKLLSSGDNYSTKTNKDIDFLKNLIQNDHQKPDSKKNQEPNMSENMKLELLKLELDKNKNVQKKSVLDDVNNLINMIQKEDEEEQKSEDFQKLQNNNNFSKQSQQQSIVVKKKNQKSKKIDLDLNETDNQKIVNSIMKKTRPLSPQGEIKNLQQKTQNVEKLLIKMMDNTNNDKIAIPESILQKQQQQQQSSNNVNKKKSNKKKSNLERFNASLQESESKKDKNNSKNANKNQQKQPFLRNYSPEIGDQNAIYNSKALKMVEELQKMIDLDEQEQKQKKQK